jgi:hypothetical protein
MWPLAAEGSLPFTERITMRRFNSWTTAALLLWAPHVHATDWWIEGVGRVVSCGAFVKAEAAMTDVPEGQTNSLLYGGKEWTEYGDVLEQWLMGFVTGVNASRPDGSKQITVDHAGTMGWLKQYCEAHPDVPLVNAAWQFVELQQQKLNWEQKLK